MRSMVNNKKQEQYKKFIAKDAAFLKKVIGGESLIGNEEKTDSNKIKI
ncbi:hypothetical protein [Carboxylicivirga taeanensis]